MHRNTNLNWSSAILLALCVAVPAACESIDDAEPESSLAVDQELVPASEEGAAADDVPVAAATKRYVGGDTLEEVILDGGTRVSFVAITSPSGESGVGVLEEIPLGAVSLANFGTLADAGVQDVFWALTEPGTPLPPQIAALEGGGEELGSQGWVLDSIANNDNITPRGAVCDSDAVFSSYVTNKGYDNEILRLNRHPDTSSLFITDSVAPGNGGLYYGYKYSPNGVDNGSYFYNIDRYYSRVGACRISGHTTVGGWEIGPSISFDYRDSSNNGWYTVLSTDVDWGDAQVTFAAHMYTGANWDWRTQIEMAAWDDIYDIGHAYNN